MSEDSNAQPETTRSEADRVLHWWPGYWRGMLDGFLGGGCIAVLVWEYCHGWL